MSSNPRTELVRARRGAAAVAVSLMLASAGVVCASAAEHTQTSVVRASTPQALHIGATSRAFVAKMRELEAQGYVQIACNVDGAVMFNPRTHRTENVVA